MGRAGVLQPFALGHYGLLGARGIRLSGVISLLLLFCVEGVYIQQGRKSKLIFMLQLSK
jgi:hypothetical protein